MNRRSSVLSLLLAAGTALANVPGGGTTGADVTVTDNGATVTLANGIVSIVITKSSGTINTVNYGGANVLAGGNNGGQVYWELESGNGVYTLTDDPKTNGGDRAQVNLHTTSATLDVDIDYALLRGNSGFYATGILSHPANLPAFPGGEWRANVYVGSTFDWLSVDAKRNRMMCAPADWTAGSPVAGAPKEVELLTQGIYKGQFECKYTYSADLGEEDAWGWSSSTKYMGIWVTKPSLEYYNGGPKKRELMCHTGPTMLNMLGGGHYGMGNAESIGAGTQERKIYGPWFYYINKVPAGTADFHNVLFQDAIAQSKAEQAAWPYSWFKDPDYPAEAGRGTVSGTFAITDPGAPNASPAGMWIGLAPDNGTDFQFQFFTYQFWVKTAADGSFTIPHVRPGSYALYAFGPGAPGTFKKTGVTVTAGQALNLGTVTWTPPRTAATLWEIGVPDRDSHEFLNGDSLYGYWATSYVKYPTEFPKGITYTVGKDDYSKVWNFALMNNMNNAWGLNPANTVNFTLPKAPTAGTQARFYLALASSFVSGLSVSVNGTSIGNITPGNPSDAMVRLGSHGAFWDTQILFNANLLKAGANTLTIGQTKAGESATIQWDYLRLEADGTGTVTDGISPRPTADRPIYLNGSSLYGDGLHGLDLLGPDGRMLGHAAAGAPLSLANLPRGTYFARCGAKSISLAWAR
jgi:rhamnogalacturonan endolyase